MITISLIYNLALLVSLSLISGIVESKYSKDSFKGKILQGFLFGVIAAIGIHYSAAFTPGMYVDGRFVVISLVALFFGPISGILAAVVAFSYHLLLDGPGVLAGSVVIFISFAVGVIFHYLRGANKFTLSYTKLYLFGLIVSTTCFFLSFIFIPEALWKRFLLYLPLVLFAAPTVSILIGKILLDNEKEAILKQNLLESKSILYSTLSNLNDAVIVTDSDTKIIYMNKFAETLTGWSYKNAESKLLMDVVVLKEKQLLDLLNSPTILDYFKTGLTDEKIQHDYLIDKNGKEIPITHQISTIINKEGKISRYVIIFRDISETLQQQKLLDESKRQLSTLISNLNGMVYKCINDENWTMIFVSLGSIDLTGYKPGELIDNKVLSYNELIHPEDRTIVRDEIQKAISERSRFHIEYRIITKGGKIKWVAEQGIGLYSEDGSLEYLEGFISDITPMKSALDKIEKTKRYLEYVFTASPAIVYVLSPDSCSIKWVSENITRIFGYTLEEVFSSNWWMKNIHSDDLDLAVSNCSKVLSEGSISFNYRFRKKNGDYIWLRDELRVVKDDNGKKKEIIGVWVDFTESMELSYKVFESESKFRAVWNSGKDAMRLVDKNGIIVDVNPAFCNMVSMAKDELIGKPYNVVYKNFLDDEILSFKEKFDKRTILRKGGVYLQFWNDKEGWYDLFADFIYPSNSDPLMLTVFRDISNEIKYHRELIAAKEKAEELNSLKSNFIYNLSHEIRTPFVGIIGYAELLKEYQFDGAIQELIDGIYDSSRRLLNTLTNLIEIARLESGDIKIMIETFDLLNLLEEIIHELQHNAEKKNIRIIKNISFDRLVIESDFHILKVVVKNILDNAIKFTEEGYIEISVDIESENGRDRAYIRIKDTGIGIEPDKFEIIFAEYRQTSEGINRSFEGLGLGLAISLKYMRLIDGDILVESTPMRGSTFTVTFPLNVKNKISRSLNDKPVDNKSMNKMMKTYSILYIEDDSFARDFIKRILQDSYSVDFAINSDEALEKIIEKQYDAFLVDINLRTGMDGVELMKKIRENPIYKNIPMVAITAFADVYDRKEFLDKGFDYYIPKPFSKKVVFDVLNKIFSKQQ